MNAKIYLMRHGESVDDVEDCYGGIADFPLTESGRQTASLLAQKLSDKGLDILFTSPYRRAYETATIVANSAKCEVTVIPELRERNSYGVISGVNKEKAKDIFGHLLLGLRSKPGDYYANERIPGDESVADFDARVRQGFDSVLRDSKNKLKVGLVTHGNVTRSIYKNILGISNKIDLDLLAMSVIVCRDNKFFVEQSEGVTEL